MCFILRRRSLADSEGALRDLYIHASRQKKHVEILETLDVSEAETPFEDNVFMLMWNSEL